MRLTNEIRDTFIKKVMDGIPWKNTMTDKLVLAEFEKRCFDALPEEVKPLRKKYPGLVATKGDRMKGPKTDYHGNHRGWYCTIPNIVDADKVKIDDILTAVALRDKEVAEREKLRLQIRGVAYHATTLNELHAALPQLVEYMPEEQKPTAKSMALAPVGLINNLKKAGLKMAAKGTRA